MDILQGGCRIWHADLDGNGRQDLILVTSDATSDGSSVATLLLIDNDGRPVPWQAVGHFTVTEDGLANLVDLDHSGRAQLLYLHVEGYDRGDARATSLARYRIEDAHLKRVDGHFAGAVFPMVQSPGAQLRQEPDLSNDLGSHPASVFIASVIKRKSEYCGVQLPVRREPGGQAQVDSERAETLHGLCYDRVALSDGRKVKLPGVVVVDRRDSRQIAFGDVYALLVEAQKSLVVQLAGRVCDGGCAPFLLWASEK